MGLLVIAATVSVSLVVVVRQVRMMRWEDTLLALSYGVCPRCHGGSYVSSCKACSGTGLSES